MHMKAFREQIINFIYKVVTGTKRMRLLLTPLFASIFFCIVLLLIFTSFYLDRFFGLPEFISKPFSIVVSLPFLIIGVLLWLWCAGKFFKTKGTPVPINPPPKLVTDGPYAYSRNPMITGLILIFFGIGVLHNSISLTFIISPIFAILNYFELKNIEEPEIEKRFCNEYLEYKKNDLY